MTRQQILPRVVLLLGLTTAIGSAGCAREESDVPPITQVEATYPTNHPVTAVGCLLAGDAANAFVLQSAQNEGDNRTRNYQLVGEPDVQFEDHVGQRVRVSGTVELRDEAHARTFATPAETEEPTGTAGETPTVQTTTTVTVDRLSVDAMTKLGEECSM